MPPSTGMQAPDRPDPLPRAVTGTSAAVHATSTAATCSAVVGVTTATGRTGVAVRASSWLSSSLTCSPVRTFSAPTAASSAPMISSISVIASTLTGRAEAGDLATSPGGPHRSSSPPPLLPPPRRRFGLVEPGRRHVPDRPAAGGPRHHP